MKKVTFLAGGMPLFTEDINYMNAGINEALFAVCKSMLRPGADAVILSGCEVTQPAQDQVQITAGWVYLSHNNTELICKVDAQTVDNLAPINITPTGDTLRWDTFQTPDAAGNKTFYDNSQQQTYKVQQARLIIDDDTQFPALCTSMRSTAWQQPTLLGGWSNQPQSELQYCIRNGHLLFRGTINGQAGDVFTLPQWAWPPRYFNAHLQTDISNVITGKSVNISTTGAVSITSQDNGEGVTPITQIPMNFMVPLW